MKIIGLLAIKFGVFDFFILQYKSFSLKGIKFLQNALLSKFKLRTRLIEKEKDQWLIVIPYRQIVKLHSIVGHLMEETMLYKVKK